MTEAHAYRYHRLAGAYVLLAPARITVIDGPDPLAGPPDLHGPCPFCPGHESATQGTLATFPPGAAPGEWRVRVVPNKYPVVADAELGEADASSAGQSAPGGGRHELVIETPEHDADLATYATEGTHALLRIVRDRARDLAQDPRIEWLHVFRNKGRKSGSSQPHPHLQLVGTTEPLPEPATRWRHALVHHARTGRNLLDDVLREELSLPERIVLENEHFRLVTPHAPMRTFEAWLVPKLARGCFSDLPDPALEALAELLPRAVRCVLGGSRRTDYNLIFRLPPVAARHHGAAFHLIEIVPRGAILAGLELATGTGVVAVTPERAAALYRAADGQ